MSRTGRTTLAGGLLVVLVGSAGCTADPSDASPRGSAARVTTSSSAPGPSPSVPNQDDLARAVPIAAGTHRIARSAWSPNDFTVTLPAGWTVQYGHVYAQHPDRADSFGFYSVVVDTLYADACRGENGPTTPVGPSSADLVTAMLAQPGAEVSGPTPATLGDRPAQRVDLRLPEQMDWTGCSYPGVGLQIWHSGPADKYFVLLPDATASVYVLEVGGRRQVFLTQTGKAATAADRAELQAVLASIRFV